MAKFMDVHHDMFGLTPEALQAAHQADLDIQGEEDVDFQRAWGIQSRGWSGVYRKRPMLTLSGASTSGLGILRQTYSRYRWRSDGAHRPGRNDARHSPAIRAYGPPLTDIWAGPLKSEPPVFK